MKNNINNIQKYFKKYKNFQINKRQNSKPKFF